MGLIIKNGVIYNGAESEPVIYSLDEREVGVWTDGKPLYERTFVFSSEVVVNQGTWANTSIDGTGIDNIIDVVCRSGGTTFGMLGARNNNNVVQLFSPMTVGVYGTTIRYTKTTDTPGSGTWTPSGVKSEHYSTNEQIVGTWIDGSPVYEKVWVFDNPPTLSTSWVNVGIDCTGFGQIIYAHCIHTDGTGYGDVCADPSNSDHMLRVKAYSSSLCKTLILRYTKTTS